RRSPTRAHLHHFLLLVYFQNRICSYWFREFFVFGPVFREYFSFHVDLREARRRRGRAARNSRSSALLASPTPFVPLAAWSMRKSIVSSRLPAILDLRSSRSSIVSAR